MAGRATFTIDVSMMTMKLATHAMARMTPGGTCGPAAGSAKAGRRSGGSGVGHDSDSFGKISSVTDLLNKFKLNKFKLIKLV